MIHQDILFYFKAIFVLNRYQDNRLSEMKEALAIRRIFSLCDMITKAEFSNSPNDLKVRLFG